MKLLRRAIGEKSILLDLKADDFESIIHHAVSHIVSRGLLRNEDGEEVERLLIEREHSAPTAIGHAVSIPHAYSDHFEQPVIVFVRLKRPINLGAPDGIPTRFLFFLLGPHSHAEQHIDSLAAIARLMSDDEFRYEASEAKNDRDLLVALDNSAERHRKTLPKEVREVPDGLKNSGRLFGGIINDLKRRLPHYKSDFVDGLHPKAISSTLFLFFACLAPAITFGGLLEKGTGGSIGAVEMLVGTAICGVIYGLFAGQPLVILGGTGPLLVFTAILYELCQDWNLEFFSVYAWTGIWTAVMLFILAITDASCLVRFFTRFTDEIFAALISVIFVYEALHNLFHPFIEIHELQKHDAALLALLLGLGTYYVAMQLSLFRRSKYLRPRVREFLADFGPTIAIASMAAVAVYLHRVDVETLKAPDTLRPTMARPWLTNPFIAPTWVWLASIVPALLATVLIYLDQCITARLVNNPDHRLHKGEGYHLDLMVVSVLIAGCSLVGLPWLVAATVRSLNHVRSLATTEEVASRDGGSKERINHIRENRVTGIAIHVLLGLSLLAIPYLALIPMAVLYGLFLFMGVVSISGNQFFERLSLWFTDSNLYPQTHYTRRVPNWTIHKFTLIQVVCLALLWTVKTSTIKSIAILFPVFIAILPVVRKLLDRWFPSVHLEALDTEEDPDEEEEAW